MKDSIKKTTIISLWTTFIAFVLFSCESKPAIVSEAEKSSTTALISSLPEMLKPKIARITTAYNSDSLVILRLNMQWKTLLNENSDEDYEYVYLTYGEHKYEGYHELNADSIFKNQEAYETEKQGKIYHELSYDEGMYYNAVLFLNEHGKLVGSENEDKSLIPNPNKTGNWQLKYYVDEFGEYTSQPYLSLKAEGTFSNSATSGSELTVFLRVDDGKAYLKLYEYGSFPVGENEFFTFRIKDSEGNISDFRWFNASSSGIILCEDDLETILEKEGEISVHAVYRNMFTSSQNYIFKINADGYNEAKRIWNELRSN